MSYRGGIWIILTLICIAIGAAIGYPAGEVRWRSTALLYLGPTYGGPYTGYYTRKYDEAGWERLEDWTQEQIGKAETLAAPDDRIAIRRIERYCVVAATDTNPAHATDIARQYVGHFVSDREAAGAIGEFTITVTSDGDTPLRPFRDDRPWTTAIGGGIVGALGFVVGWAIFIVRPTGPASRNDTPVHRGSGPAV